MVRAFLDANVLYSAYLKRWSHQYGSTSAPFGILERAQAGELEVVVSDVVVAELVDNLLEDGETTADIDEFLDMVSPVLDPDSRVKARLGRDYAVEAAYADDGLDKLGDLLADLCPDYETQIKSHPEVNSLAGERDDYDLHVMVCALDQQVDCLITSNTKHFPPRIGEIRVIKPGTFLSELEQATATPDLQEP